MILLLGRIAGILVRPLTLSAILALLSVGAMMFGRGRLRNYLFAAAFAVAYLGSIVPVGDCLLAPLENRYPPIAVNAALSAISGVVVLGSGYAPRSGLPVTAALDEDGLVRIVEGVRLFRRLRHALLIVSGGASPGRVPPAAGYEVLARELGIPPTSIVVLARGLDTAQEARAIESRLGDRPFLLVTSAWHMPRAMAQMRLVGAIALPAPTGQLTGRPWDWGSWLPSAGGSRRSEIALHEYLGLLAIRAGVGR